MSHHLNYLYDFNNHLQINSIKLNSYPDAKKTFDDVIMKMENFKGLLPFKNWYAEIHDYKNNLYEINEDTGYLHYNYLPCLYIANYKDIAGIDKDYITETKKIALKINHKFNIFSQRWNRYYKDLLFNLKANHLYNDILNPKYNIGAFRNALLLHANNVENFN